MQSNLSLTTMSRQPVKLAQFYDTPRFNDTRECAPQVVKCEPRNAWESFTNDFHHQTVHAFSEGVGIVVTVLLLAAVGSAVTRIFRQSGKYTAIYAMAMSGVAACALAFALMTYPRHEPYLIGIGVALAVGAIIAVAATFSSSKN